MQQTRHSKEASRSSPLWLTLLPAALLLILFLGVAYFFYERLQELEGRVAAVGRRVEETVRQMEEMARLSQEATLRAGRAEEQARRAAEGRWEAEAARQEALKQAATAQQEARLAREEVERVRREREAELDRLQKSLNQLVETRRTALGLVMNIGSDFIQFDFDKADLKPRHRELLSRIVGVLLTSTGYRVQVFGHTDDVGSQEYNLELSRRRAQAVRDYMVEAGIDPEIISIQGFGKSNPLVPGTSAEARAKNRRVEIGIIDTVVDYKGPLGQPAR